MRVHSLPLALIVAARWVENDSPIEQGRGVPMGSRTRGDKPRGRIPMQRTLFIALCVLASITTAQAGRVPVTLQWHYLSLFPGGAWEPDARRPGLGGWPQIALNAGRRLARVTSFETARSRTISHTRGASE